MSNMPKHYKEIENMRARIDQTYSYFNQWAETEDEMFDPSWSIESTFLQLIALAEVLQLSEQLKIIVAEYSSIKSQYKFSESGTDPEGDIYSKTLSRIQCHFCAIERLLQPKSEQISKFLSEILRDSIYTITDKRLFGHAPQDENDVHLRIEGILKPIFPDLKHKPALSKPIKNFEPDTGIPSRETLIEYKFITKPQDAPRIADEILADTRGYKSRDWNTFIYLIYETVRCKSEKEWNLLLRESGVSENTTAIVLCGEPHSPKSNNKQKTH